jgi:CRP/FNR family transcriptional regulator, anaerobic regulatory protein
MLNEDDINFLRNCIPFYAQLNIDEQEQLKQATSKRKVTKGEQFSDLNDPCNGLIVLKNGRIRAFILTVDGREMTLFRLQEKDICILSASCLFKNVNFTVYLDVEKDSSIYLIPTIVFEKLSHNNIKVKEYLLENMSSRFSSAIWVMEHVVFGSLSKRVASFILEQTLLEDNQTLYITHEVIAKNIGSAREVISRMLKYFEQEQIISTARGKICVLDQEKLKILTQ